MALPEWVVALVPSPQFTVYVPVCPSTSMVMVSLPVVVCHVVTKSLAPKLAALADAAAAKPNSILPGTMSSGMSETASIRLPCISCNTSAGMLKFNDVMPDILARSSNSRVAVAVLLAAAPCSCSVLLP